MEPKQQQKDILVIGFALFAMFFGAGNMIFPPHLGLETGNQWPLGFFSFTFADAGLALVAILALVTGSSDSLDGLLRRLGRVPALLLSSACFLCIGPLLAIPRTAASTFELAVQPSFSLGSVPFSFLYFALVLALTLRPTKVIDIVGKILTPALYVCLLALIIKGVITPLGPLAETAANGVFLSGLMSGYQTMDVIAAVVFIILIADTLNKRGYNKEEKTRITIFSGVIAALGLTIVYGGLTYLGATASTLYGLEISQTELLLAIVDHLLGNGGVLLLGVIVALACLTTATGLTSAVAAYFARFIPQKRGYEILVVIICLFSAVVSNFGISTIVAFSGPVLNIVYPAILVVILLSFFDKPIANDNVYRFSVGGALLASIFATLLPETAAVLPLESFGFGWLLPAAVCGVIGWFIKPKKQSM